MKIIFKEPGKPAELRDIPNELEDARQLYGLEVAE